LPLELPPKLLRVSQEQEFERLGGNRTIRVNVRIVAATNVDLVEMVEERRFRADLFYRLNVFPIALLPLRKRSEDIPELVWHFVRAFAGRMNKVINVGGRSCARRSASSSSSCHTRNHLPVSRLRRLNAITF
jgi:transcriptional regulator with GAF, ATPase, and Fis domain